MKKIIFVLLMIAVAGGTALSQNSVFGKNKVQYKKFDWSFIQTNHFDVYYSQGGYELAEYTAEALESSYNDIKKLVKYEINNRVSVIVYNSHNDWQQTNVINEYLEEGIQGVTELFKNRIVLPFEGDYGLLRHVIHHELTHAVINDMFYGGSIQSLISSRMPVQLPLWLNEGLAEYASVGWNVNADMFMRDATVQNYLPPIEYLGGIFAYQGGNSLWNYIAMKYGEQKIGEILNRIKGTRSVEQGFKSTIGLSLKELSDRWQKEQKVMYWPDIAKREEPADFARRLTDHTKDENFYNTSPFISPQGDKIAFISDRNDYFDVFLMSAIDGTILEKLVSGQRTNNFEELHLITPGISWSPDGRKIALAVKAGEADALVLIDVDSGDQQQYEFPLDGIFSVNWSPKGDKIAFVGVKAPQSDIYVYDLQAKQLTNLTNDLFSDFDPSFSPDEKTIYFSSDRQNFVNPSVLPAGFKMYEFNVKQRDIYSLNTDTRVIHRLTNFENGDETSPLASPDGKKLLYISNRSGINNIYQRDLVTNSDHPITNSLSGIHQMSVSSDGSKLVFSSLQKAGFDIFLMRSPFERKLSVSELEPTEFIKRKLELPRTEKPREIVASTTSSDTVAVRDNIIVLADTTAGNSRYSAAAKVDLKNFIFTQEAMRDTIATSPTTPHFEVTNNRDSEGNYVSHKYKLNFTPDLVYGNAAYSTFYGVQGTTLMAFSDMLGDHQIIFQTNLLLDLKNSDYALAYYYLPGRIDWGFQGFHSARFLLMNDRFGYSSLFRFRMWALGLSAMYPIDRFNRLDLSAMWLNLSRDNLDNAADPPQRRSFILPVLSYVKDNSIWQGGWFAPNNGSRFNLTTYGSTKFSDESLELLTVTADYRDYNRISRDFLFVYRLAAGISNGKDRQHFFVGGTEGWINRRFDGGSIPIVNVEDYAFLTPVLPLRGYNYNAHSGTRFALANLEFRFPLVRYFILGALPVGFQNILGAAFLDVGSAWSDTKRWQAFDTDPSGSTRTRDLLIGTGFGARLFFLGFPLRVDVAWRYNGSGFSEPTYYFSLGADF